MCGAYGPSDGKSEPLRAEVAGSVRRRNVKKAAANGQTLDAFQEQPFQAGLTENIFGGLWNGFQHFRELKW